MLKVQSTPKHLTAILKAHAKESLRPLKHELDPQEGWSELLSPASTDKGLIHKFVDRNYQLSGLFRKVSSPSSPLTMANLDGNAACPWHVRVLIHDFSC